MNWNCLLYTSEVDNTQIVSEMYEVFAKENARAASQANYQDVYKRQMYMMPERLKLFKTGRTGQKPL